MNYWWPPSDRPPWTCLFPCQMAPFVCQKITLCFGAWSPLSQIVYLSDARDRDRDPLPRVDVLALHLQGHRVQPQPEGWRGNIDLYHLSMLVEYACLWVGLLSKKRRGKFKVFPGARRHTSFPRLVLFLRDFESTINDVYNSCNSCHPLYFLRPILLTSPAYYCTGKSVSSNERLYAN